MTAPSHPAPAGPHPDGSIWALVAVLGGALLLLFGTFVYHQNHLPGSSCSDWYVYCPTGPGDTPLGTAFQFGNSSSLSVSAGGPPLPGCSAPGAGLEYCKTLDIQDVSQGVATDSIGFQFLNGAGSPVPYRSVTLLDGEGRGIAFVTPGGTWTLCTPSDCEASSSTVVTALPAALATNEELVLDAGPSASFPSGLTAWGLEAFGTGSFDGTVGPVLFA